MCMLWSPELRLRENPRYSMRTLVLVSTVFDGMSLILESFPLISYVYRTQTDRKIICPNKTVGF